MRNFASRLVPVALVSALALPVTAQTLSDLNSRSGRPVARAADANRDGAVSAEEWGRFLAEFETDASGSYDRDLVVARIVSAFADEDTDGSFTGADVNALLESIDTNGDGTLATEELLLTVPLPYGQGAGTPRENAQERLIEGLVAWGIDANLDQTVTAEEWAAAVRTGQPAVPVEALAGWIESTVTNAPEDPNRFGAPTMILTLRGTLDATYDQSLRGDDFAQLFSDLDTDGDGALSADELSAPDRSWEGVQHEPREVKAYAEPLMPWQRTLEDALVLSSRWQKPLLICVNTDGESASDQLAATRYRDPEFVELARGFLPLLASPDRHNVRDYDDDGRRISDPRFGRLVDVEHIDIEPRLFERYFNGQRLAPRHVGVAPDGTILFDLYLLNDLSVIDRHLAKHGEFDVELPDPQSQTDAELFDNPDAAARDLLEARFAGGDDDVRRYLAEAAMDTARTTQHPELVRMALRDELPAVREIAVRDVAAFASRMPIELFPEAIRAATDREQLAAIGSALREFCIGLDETAVLRPRRLARITDALVHESTVDVDLWRVACEGLVLADEPPVDDVEVLYRALARLDAARTERPRDARPELFFSRTALRVAQHLIDTGGNPTFILEDARASAERAVELDPENPLGWAYLARAAYLTPDFEKAADAAARALPRMVDRAGEPIVAHLLDAFIQSRTRLIYERFGTDEGWPASWLADLAAAYRIQLVHPRSTEAQLQASFEAQATLELYDLQREFIRGAVERFPGSSNLHHYLRWQVLRDEGSEGLVETYRELEVSDAMRPTLDWFAGLAAFRAAERAVENRKHELAIDLYEDSVVSFSESVDAEPGFADSANYYVALAWAGMGRVQLELGDLDEALVAVHESFDVDPNAMEQEDGLGNRPSATIRAVASALRRDGRDAEAEELLFLGRGQGPEPAASGTE